jgi:hypothetical protein
MGGQMQKLKPFYSLFWVLAIYGFCIIILDRISDSWGLPLAVVVPIIMTGQLLVVICTPENHRLLVSKILLAVSLLAIAPLNIAMELSMPWKTEPNYYESILAASVFLVPLIGLVHWAFVKRSALRRLEIIVLIILIVGMTLVCYGQYMATRVLY